MEAYQPIYDAVRSRLSNGDIGAAVQDALRAANLEHYASVAAENVRACAADVAAEQIRPSVLYRPTLIRCRHGISEDLTWCATLGEPGQSLNTYGPTPDAAMRAFDKAWVTST